MLRMRRVASIQSRIQIFCCGSDTKMSFIVVKLDKIIYVETFLKIAFNSQLVIFYSLKPILLNDQQ